MSDVTRILSSIKEGDPKAAEQLLPLVYDELRRLAAQRMARESPGQTLQATVFVRSLEYRYDNINADFQTYVHTFGPLQTDLLGLEAAILGSPANLNFA
jgi:hypothetical protein